MECLCVRWSDDDITIELRSNKPLTASSLTKFGALAKEAERLTNDPGTLVSLGEDNTKDNL